MVRAGYRHYCRAYPRNGTNSAADESAAESVAAAAVVADDRASKRAKGTTGDGALLSVGPRADASGEKTETAKNRRDEVDRRIILSAKV